MQSKENNFTTTNKGFISLSKKMKYTILFLFIPVLSFSQKIFVTPGLLATNQTGKTELYFNTSAGITIDNEALSFTMKASRSKVLNYYQIGIGPHFGPFEVDLTFDLEDSREQTRSGVGIRFAGHFRLIDQLALLVDFNTGINGEIDNYAMLGVGLSYNIRASSSSGNFEPTR